jgi:hypothetical protein
MATFDLAVCLKGHVSNSMETDCHWLFRGYTKLLRSGETLEDETCVLVNNMSEETFNERIVELKDYLKNNFDSEDYLVVATKSDSLYYDTWNFGQFWYGEFRPYKKVKVSLEVE